MSVSERLHEETIVGGKEMKKFDITFFYGPSSEEILENEKIVADIAAAGISLCQVRGKTAEANRKAILILKKYGLCASVFEEPRIRELIRGGDPDRVDEVIREVVQDYAEFDNLDSWDIFDEPSSDVFPMLAAVQEALHRYDPAREVIINLFPCYAMPEQYKDTDYLTHVNRFVETVRPDLLSYDNYSFRGRPNPNAQAECDAEEKDGEDERAKLIRLNAAGLEDRDDFFENLEIIRHIGLENELDQMLIVLLTEHGDYRNLTKAELFWEVNMCLAYGMRRISYFTYWHKGTYDPYWRWDNSMCDTKGNKFQHYYDAQGINKVIRPIGEKLFATKSSAVYHIGNPEKGTTAFEGFGAVTKVDGENAVIGFFEDGSIYLVNRDFRNENTLTVYAEKELNARINGAFEPVGKEYTVTLPAGEAILFMV